MAHIQQGNRMMAGWATMSGESVGTGAFSASLTASGWGQEITNTGTITGPAPLAVFFDATATTAATYEPFREAGYHFDFGYATPSTPGTWAYSSKPKGNQIGGPVAAHVYETPGTYTASVRAQLPNGQYQDRFVTVVVEDPDTYWTTGGRSTVTISTTTGAWSTWASNTRYLLTAGLDYTARGAINIRDIQNVLVARTGSGADPIVSNLRFNYTTGSTPPTGARVVFNQINSAGELSASVSGDDCLFYKCSGEKPIVGDLLLSGYNSAPTLTWSRPRRIFYWVCTCDGGNLNQPFFKQAYQLVVVGCSSVNPVEHGCRVQGAQYAFIGHNWLHDQGTAKHALTLRADGIGSLSSIVNDSATPASRYIVSADNLLSDGAETSPTWPLYIGPQGATWVESLEYVIAERNTFTEILGGWTGSPVYAAVRGCRQITVRDDIYLASGVTTGTTNYDPNYGAVPAEWSNGPLYSNTFLTTPPDNVDAFLTPTAILPSKAGT